MGHDNLNVSSPAHRRSQNPASPSAALFRRSSTFPREEPDLSWVALFRRHRFLLLMLALLAFLCTVYLYFAIKLGADDCSGLIGKDAALCRLKKSKSMNEHDQRTRRMLMNVQKSLSEPSIKDKFPLLTSTDTASWMKFLIEARAIQNTRILGCTGTNLTQDSQFTVFLPTIGCQERDVIAERSAGPSPNNLEMDALDPSSSFDLICCERSNMEEFFNDEDKFWKLDKLLNDKGIFVWILENTGDETSKVQLEHSKLHSWSYLGRMNNIVIWQKV
ncbi:hypothetical protein KP509_30G070300 [Ceratopteris richardii]|uniref:Uncharacterized protein n=1 Tax=Ceratopteris richardii TaxID=49495 RepID=A0A8T2R577_CERRI|nr:hypothetical protein KP509_30G070300 [Ceratopteris richardii]KAH7290944.1 hypothetical protein KP509_30G070300 [Ceratopteris richardii]